MRFRISRYPFPVLKVRGPAREVYPIWIEQGVVAIPEDVARKCWRDVSEKIEAGILVVDPEFFSQDPLVTEPEAIDGLDPHPEIPTVYEADSQGYPVLYASLPMRPRYTRDELEADPSLIPNVHDVDRDGVPVVYKP